MLIKNFLIVFFLVRDGENSFVNIIYIIMNLSKSSQYDKFIIRYNLGGGSSQCYLQRTFQQIKVGGGVCIILLAEGLFNRLLSHSYLNFKSSLLAP